MLREATSPALEPRRGRPFELPVVIHVTSHVFSRDGHPGVHRVVRSLEGRAKNVVLGSAQSGYVRVEQDDAERSERVRRGTWVHRIELPELRLENRARALLSAIRRRHGPLAAVVGHLGNNGWRSVLLARNADLPLLTFFHGTDVTIDLDADRYRSRYRSLFEAPAHTSLTVSDNLSALLSNRGIENVATCRLPIDPAPPGTNASRAPNDPLRLVLVGRLIEVKGHGDALEALAILRDAVPGSTLDLFGDGELLPELEETARRLDLSSAVRFRGVVAAEDLRRELAGFHVALQPSRESALGSVEGVPNAILEAMAAGLPVVATRHGGIPEAVVEGETGLLVPPAQPRALAEALLRLAREEPLRQKLGAAGMARVADRFSMDLCGDAFQARIDEARRRYHAMPAPMRTDAWSEAARGLRATGAGWSVRSEVRAWQRRLRGLPA